MNVVEMLQSIKAEMNKVLDKAIADIQDGKVEMSLPSTAAALNTIGGVRIKSSVPYSVKMPDGTIIAEITGQRTFELALESFFKNPENKKIKCSTDAPIFIHKCLKGNNPVITTKEPVNPRKYNKRGARWYLRGLKIEEQIKFLTFCGMSVMQ